MRTRDAREIREAVKQAQQDIWYTMRYKRPPITSWHPRTELQERAYIRTLGKAIGKAIADTLPSVERAIAFLNAQPPTEPIIRTRSEYCEIADSHAWHMIAVDPAVGLEQTCPGGPLLDPEPWAITDDGGVVKRAPRFASAGLAADHYFDVIGGAKGMGYDFVPGKSYSQKREDYPRG